MASSMTQQESHTGNGNEPNEATYLLGDARSSSNHPHHSGDFTVSQSQAPEGENGIVDEAQAKNRTRKELLVAIYILGVCFVVLLATHGIMKFKSWSYAIVFTPMTVMLYVLLYLLMTFREEAETSMQRYFSLSFIRITFLLAVTLFFSTYMMSMLNFCTMDPEKSPSSRYGKINWYLVVMPLIIALMFGFVGLPLYTLVRSLVAMRRKWPLLDNVQTRDEYVRELNRLWKYALVVLVGVCISCTLVCIANYFMQHFDAYHISWCFFPLYILEFFSLGIVVIHEASKLLAPQCASNVYMRWMMSVISTEEDQPWLVGILLIAPGCIFSQAAIGLFGLLGSSVFLSLLIPWTFACLYVGVLLQSPADGGNANANGNRDSTTPMQSSAA